MENNRLRKSPPKHQMGKQDGEKNYAKNMLEYVVNNIECNLNNNQR